MTGGAQLMLQVDSVMIQDVEANIVVNSLFCRFTIIINGHVRKPHALLHALSDAIIARFLQLERFIVQLFVYTRLVIWRPRGHG